MKHRPWTLAFALVVAGSLFLLHGGITAPTSAGEALPAPQVGLEGAEGGFTSAFSFPRCSWLNGRSCSSPGSYGYCQWTPYEPEVCICQSNYTWRCPA